MFEERVGIVAAMPAEVASWHHATLAHADHPLLIECSGIGPKAAANATRGLIQRGVDSLLSWGTAGGLDRALRPGTIVLYASVVDAASGTEYQCDLARTASLARQLQALGIVHVRGVSVSEPVADVAAKLNLQQRFQGGAVDMESASIAALAAQAGIAFTALRVIVDPAEFSLPRSALAGIGSNRWQWLAVTMALLRNPWEIRALIRVAHGYHHALGRLDAASRALSGSRKFA